MPLEDQKSIARIGYHGYHFLLSTSILILHRQKNTVRLSPRLSLPNCVVRRVPCTLYKDIQIRRNNTLARVFQIVFQLCLFNYLICFMRRRNLFLRNKLVAGRTGRHGSWLKKHPFRLCNRFKFSFIKTWWISIAELLAQFNFTRLTFTVWTWKRSYGNYMEVLLNAAVSAHWTDPLKCWIWKNFMFKIFIDFVRTTLHQFYLFKSVKM